MKTKRQIGRKIISFLTTVAMVVGMMSGMTLEVKAQEYNTAVSFDSLAVGDTLVAGAVISAPNTSYNRTIRLVGGTYIEGGNIAQSTTGIQLCTNSTIYCSITICDDGALAMDSSTKWYPCYNGNCWYVSEIVNGDSKFIYLRGAPEHTHSFTYSADGATITATCDADSCPLTESKATLTINAPAKKSIDDFEEIEATITDANSIKGTAEVSYYKANDDGTGKTGDPLEFAPKAAGTYWAEITLGSGSNSATAYVVYTIAKKAADVLTEDVAKEKVDINYIKESVITTDDSYEVSSSNSEYEAVDSITDILDKADDPKIYVRKAETDDTAPSNWVAISLSSRPDAPTNLTVEKATDAETVDGKIKGTTQNMEYKADDGTSDWTIAPEDAAIVKAGDYLVRYKATLDKPASKAIKVTVGSKKEDSTVLMTDATIEGLTKSGQTLIANISPVDADGDFTYQWKRDNVAIDGATKETYTLTDADVGKKITVEVKQIIGGKVVAEKTSAETSTVTAGSEYDDEIIVITGIDIEGVARVGRTLTAVYKPEDASGTITYQWTKDKADISGATNKTYTLKDEDEGSEISVIVTQTIDGVVVKNIISDDVTIKAEIVAPPKLKAKTTTSITIIGAEGYEYSIDGGSTWQDDTVFEGLEPNMEYSIVCRKKATDTSPAGKVSAGLIVKTNAKDIVTDNEIKDNKEYGDGYIRTETNIDRDVPKNTIVNLDVDLAESLMTEDEKKKVKDDGAVCRLYLDVKSKDISNLPEEERQAISDAAKQLNGDAELGMFLDLSMYLQVDNSTRPISDLNGKKVTITIEIPEELRSPDGKERTFYIVRYHEGKADILAVSGSTSITFETELFSTYSVAYSDSTKAYLVSKQKVFGANYFTEYGKDLSKYKYKFKVDDKSQKKTISATKKMIKAKKAGTAKVALYRKTRKGGSWEKIEEHEFVVEKPEVTKKVTTLKQGDTAEALSFVTNKMVVKPTYFLSSKPEIVEVDFHTGKLKVLKKGKTTITISYGNGYGAAKYKTKLIVK